MVKRSSAKRKAPSLGPWVANWIEQNLVHGGGDYFGKPFLLAPFQRDILHQIYELNKDGTRRYNRVLIGLPKGNGKTPLAAAIACAEFMGPVVFDYWKRGRPYGKMRTSPDIPVAAVSYEQADLVFGTARLMIRHGTDDLGGDCEIFDTEILFRDEKPGRMYRVPAVAGANDGGFHSFWVADELHEWTGPRERVHLVLSNNRAKRQQAWQLAITTAGWDFNTLCGRLYQLGKRIDQGIEKDPGFLCIWREASPHWDLTDPKQLASAIKEANPALGYFVDLDTVMRQYYEMGAEHEFRRYFLNQFTAPPSQWLAPELWSGAERAEPVEPGTSIVMGFDGSYNRDSTALIGCTLADPHRLFVLGLWEKPEGTQGEWSVPREDVLKAIEDAVATYQVQGFGTDDTFGRIWGMDLEGFAAKGLPIAEWPTRSQSRIAPAAAQFLAGLHDGRLLHPGDPRLTAHALNAVGKGTRWGPVPTKLSPDSTRHIDALIAGIIAYDVAIRQGAEATAWQIL